MPLGGGRRFTPNSIRNQNSRFLSHETNSFTSSSRFFIFFSFFFPLFFLNLSLHPSGKILLLPFPSNREIFLRLKSFLRFVVIIIGSLDLLHSCE